MTLNELKQDFGQSIAQQEAQYFAQNIGRAQTDGMLKLIGFQVNKLHWDVEVGMRLPHVLAGRPSNDSAHSYN